MVFNSFSFLVLTVSVKRIEKTKNRVKSDLEATIKATDSKHVEVLSAIEPADSKWKEMEPRTIRALDELDPPSIDDDEAEPFESSAEISISDYPELVDFDFSQPLKGFDFSSIPISALTTFQK